MPYPQEYQVATIKFQDFLSDVKENCDFGSNHMAYTVTQGVFRAFRRRLCLEDAIRFSNILPVGLRALFVADWDPKEELKSFSTSAAEINKEIQALREAHNFTFLTDKPVKNVFDALVKYVDSDKLDEFMSSLPNEAKDFWQ